VKANKIPSPLFARLQKEFGKDLKQAFELMQDDTLKIVEEAGEKGWTVEQMMAEIDRMSAQ
jgi:hypothetical protein